MKSVNRLLSIVLVPSAVLLALPTASVGIVAPSYDSLRELTQASDVAVLGSVDRTEPGRPMPEQTNITYVNAVVAIERVLAGQVATAARDAIAVEFVGNPGEDPEVGGAIPAGRAVFFVVRTRDSRTLYRLATVGALVIERDGVVHVPDPSGLLLFMSDYQGTGFDEFVAQVESLGAPDTAMKDVGVANHSIAVLALAAAAGWLVTRRRIRSSVRTVSWHSRGRDGRRPKAA